MKLSPRLMTVAESVGTCNILADVGTDHGYIPVYMLEHGLCNKAYASDIREQPLSRAAATIKENGLSDKAETFLSNGIADIPEDYDALVIAGMGGETIVSILEAKRPPKNAKLVLQPMTEEQTLREYLYTHGYVISDETAVSEPGHVYTVITAVDGITESFCYRDVIASPAFCSKKSDASETYIMKYIRKETRVLEGLRNASNPDSKIISEKEQELQELNAVLQLVKI